MSGELSEHGDSPGDTEAFDPLLDSFAEKYVVPWERLELARVESPLYLRQQIDDAGELFDRARTIWIEEVDFVLWGSPAERDYWDPRTLEAAAILHRVLLTGSRFDVSRPDELGLGDVRFTAGVPALIPNSAVYASVAMLCAVMAADECCRISRSVEIEAQLRPNYLAELYALDNELWRERIVAALKALAADVGEAREYIAVYVGAARTALVLATSVWTDVALQRTERLTADLVSKLREAKVTLDRETRRRIAEESRARLAREKARANKENAAVAKRAISDTKRLMAIKKYREDRLKKPNRLKNVLYDEICRDLKISPRTLDKYLGYARKEGLIDKGL